jgi:hypothetical protein
MNLIDFGFQNANLFAHMPRFDEILYLGLNEEKVRRYRATREGQPCLLLSLSTIRKDEKILWEAVEDFLKRGIANAAAAVHGVYIFDLLTVDIHKEVKTFNHAELTSVIVNNARELAPEGMRLVKYSSVYALLRKTVAEDWGKLVFKSSVAVFNDKPEYLDILVKQLLRDFQFPREPVILLLNDLSQNPVYDRQNEVQQARLKKVMADLIPASIEFVPEVYIQDKNGARELLSGCTL